MFQTNEMISTAHIHFEDICLFHVERQKMDKNMIFKK